jgi:hypothetical protein
LRIVRDQRLVVGLDHRDLETESFGVLETEAGVGAIRRDTFRGEPFLPERESFI